MDGTAMTLARVEARTPLAEESSLDAFLPTTQAEKMVDLFSRADVMKAFDMRGNDKFYRMLDQGQLEAVYHGGRLMVTGASIRRCLAALPKYQPKHPVAA